MAVTLNERAFQHAKRLVEREEFVCDQGDDWSEHQPTAEQEREYIRQHGFDGYARWYLGIDDEKAPDTKGHYKFPCGDFRHIHRCGILAVESRAGQFKFQDIARAAARIRAMIDRVARHPVSGSGTTTTAR